MSFVLPHFRSSFSLLYGTDSPERIVETIAGTQHQSALIADRNNLYACYDFYHVCLERGIKPIIGVELDTAIGAILFICKNHDGFKNISRLVTSYQLEQKPDIETISKYSGNIMAVVHRDIPMAQLKEMFNDDLYLKVDYDKPSQSYRVAQTENIKPVALPSVTFLNQADWGKHRLLRAIDKGYLLANLPPSETAASEEYLKSDEWYHHFYTPFPDAVYNSEELQNKCHLTLPERKNILPDIAIDGDHYERLQTDVINGLTGRIDKITGTYQARIEYELSVIKRTGFVDYFIIVEDIIKYCRRESIAAVGRGSAAGSLVAFSLGITEVDPIIENLYFERFLNEARTDCPDIDLDIDWRRRDDVLDYVYDKYGRDHVAMMATYTHFQPRLAIRESAKAYGIEPERISQLARQVSSHPLSRNDFPERIAGDWGGDKAIFTEVLKAAQSIYGLPRHLGIHSGGIVITPDPISNYVPLEQATKGLVITQCDMYQAEKIGLVKIDILGQRGLAVIADCLEEVRKIKGDDFRVPDNDPQTYEMIRNGKTIGVFQIESPGMRATLKDLKPKILNDITLALAIIRPGASESGMKKIFMERFHGKEKTVYPHPSLEPVLKETHGVFIYQEQVILGAQKIAGFNLPASDLLRRAITKMRKKTDRQKLAQRFLDGARQNGVDDATANSIFKQLRQFASFGFCKAHAATYANLAYQSAYFKTHYPGMFMAAVLKNGGGYYRSAVYVAEARRLKIKIMPPDLNRSEKFDSLQSGQIFLGLYRVRDITARTVEQIIKERPFNSLGNFLSKIDISEREIENLIKIGFFDSIETSRPKLLWEYRLYGRRRQKNGSDLFASNQEMPQIKNMPTLNPFSRYEIFKAEKDILEIPASFHPLTLFDTYQNHDIGQLFQNNENRKISLIGWLSDRKRIKTRDGKWMVFLTFDSPDDTFEVVLFPDIFARYRTMIYEYRYLHITGTVNREGGNLALLAQRISPHPTGLKERKYI